MTTCRVPGARAGRADPGSRWGRALAATLLAVPAMLLADLASTHRLPPLASAALVALVVLLVVAALPARSRLALAAVVALAQAAGQTLLAVTQTGTRPGTGSDCLPVIGRGAALGLQFALLRQDAGCPRGTLAPGPAAPAALATMLTAALLLIGHALVAVLAGAVVAAGTTALAAARVLVAMVAIRRPRRRTALTPPSDGRLPAPEPVAVRPDRWQCGAVGRRGPPVGVLPA